MMTTSSKSKAFKRKLYVTWAIVGALGLVVGLIIGLMIPTQAAEAATSESRTTQIESDYAIKEPASLGVYRLSAYCCCKKCCGKWADGYTATMTKPQQGRTIAVDPSVIPYGSVILIDGHEYIAEDCGGSIKGNAIDVYFDSHQEALDFGIQYQEIYIIEGSDING